MKAATTATTTRFHFVGGKGGVGKTTCAAALALDAARRARVLAASVDPAPSLADALRTPLGAAPTRIRSTGRQLWAVEIDAGRALDRWLADRRGSIERVMVEGTWLDRDDVRRLLSLSLPGIDEIAALLEIARLARDGRFDLVVVDTAPTGHTLRLLALPSTLGDIALVFDRMREKARVVQSALTGAWRPGAEDALVRELADTATELAALFRDPVRTRLSWVTLPEPMAVAETRDALDLLHAAGITVDTVIVNRLTPDPPSRCRRCEARQAFERTAVDDLPRPDHERFVMARDTEPRGIRALSSIGAGLRGEGAIPAFPRRRRQSSWTFKLTGTAVKPSALVPVGVRLVLLGGKGGVGKTTCAAALALDVAASRTDARVLLISTDPAHSLGDVFAAEVGAAASPVEGGPANLDVQELDSRRLLDLIRVRYVESVDRAFDRLAGGGRFDAAHDRAVMRGLIDLAPPGLDELAAILEITDAVLAEPPRWDVVIMDTAPTGHALRLLETPALMHDWVRALMSILLKYEGIGSMGQFAEILLRLSKGLGRLRALLSDPGASAFVAVTRAAALPRLETARLLSRLSALGIGVPALLINAVGRGSCARCERKARAERAEIARIRRLDAGRIIVTAAVIPPPLGAAALAHWGRAAWKDAPGYHQGR